ncbi:splicing factor ESS-2 homolog [Caerostris extrusa]|uniref:Splicing factor ESS-2 homolog n=1 Tax=Caerostris extrusa TaxID=172846 RepID=A0AAV4SIT4_CAEEX|nr:splicing factor ESS-2 homolog [Caerostris extrusa]
MEVMKVSESPNCQSVISYTNSKIHSQKKTKKILTEEEYTEKMEKIITRDFFPDLPKLKAQNAYLDAMAKGDIARIQEIQMAYRLTDSTRSKMQSERSTVFTPATFETPDIKQMDSPSRTEETEISQSAPTGIKEKSLDQFLNNTTSEDNASFQVVMERSEHAHKQKYPWLYKDEETESKKVTDMLSLPTAAIEFKKPELAMWTYKNKNALMYVPDGVELTPEERLALGRKQIKHKNTHFEGGAPFAGDSDCGRLLFLMGKKSFSTGQWLWGVNDTPLMTWGEIEGTPFRLDGGDTPLPQNLSGQQFKIPQPSARERIAHSLADKVAKKHRKNPSGKSPYPVRSPSCSPMTTQERLLSMSPAARRLACAKLGVQWGSDRALRASYSPSPVRKPSTPLLTPSPVPSSKPKRHKASDFF